YGLLLDNMTEGVSLASQDGIIIYTNPAEDRMFGYGPGELVGQHVTVQNAYPPEENARIVADVIAELKANGIWRGEWLNRRKDGTPFYTSSHITAVELDGRPCWLCVQQDITERRAAEEALRTSEARLRRAQEVGGIGDWEWNLETGKISWSKSLYRMLGTTPADFTPSASAFLELIHPEDRAHAMTAAEAAIRGEHPLDVEFRILLPDGSVRWLASRGEIERDRQGRPSRLVGINFDVTARKRVEEALREGEERLRLALDYSRMGDWSWDAATDLVTFSPRAAEIFGIPPGPHMTWTELRGLLHPEDAERAGAAVERVIAEGSHYDIDYRVTRPEDGRQVWVAANGRASYGRDGRVLGMTGLVQDVTERKRAEERQQLLLHELNHRVKNTLATVQSIAAQTLRNAASPAAFRETFEARLMALSQAHNLLTAGHWQGASLRALLEQEFAPYADEVRTGVPRFGLDGPDLQLGPKAAVALGMAFHELATNAAKYGALSTESGRVEVLWRTRETESGRHLDLAWAESGGPPVAPPMRRGFGSRLVERGVAAELGGAVRLDFDPAGLRCEMEIPLNGAGSPGLTR
ncbi:MAG: PAS domain-containing protein, partial [Pseudomonadota bacterium]|nr:PAS domain-containing protein [Pseudomonadota bacterium]